MVQHALSKEGEEENDEEEGEGEGEQEEGEDEDKDEDVSSPRPPDFLTLSNISSSPCSAVACDFIFFGSGW